MLFFLSFLCFEGVLNPEEEREQLMNTLVKPATFRPRVQVWNT
jgi:hypothetical protein